jgi:hypothetical protein
VSARLALLSLAIVGLASCVIAERARIHTDPEVQSYCLKIDGLSLETTFEVVILGECMFDAGAWCEATLDEDGVVRVAGEARWRERNAYCSNTIALNATATCALPIGWESASFELDGEPYAPVSCNR